VNDFFETGSSLDRSDSFIKELIQEIYDIKINCNDVFFGINLIWPKFDLPKTYHRYFLSWHTEQIDVHWLISQAQRVYPSPVMVASDTNITLNDCWPDNIITVRHLTWGYQLHKLIRKFGINQCPILPRYKISSLSFRVSQYKKFVTAYLLKNFDHNDIMMTYHGWLGKDQDNHGHPPGFPWLDSLSEITPPIFINFKDDYNLEKNSPVENGNWNVDCYQHALYNLTNESFHYTLSKIQGKSFVYPRPYVTEKTWKPLLAGRPFISVSQAGVYQSLTELGFVFEYGLDLSFDHELRDLVRIKQIFDALDVVRQSSIAELYESSYKSTCHNLKIINDGIFYDTCQKHNQKVKNIIENFLF
jgi:hypothetical protein